MSSNVVKSIEAFQENPCAQTEENMMEVLRGAQFILPTIVDAEPVTGDTKHRFSIWQADDGINYLPVFTDQSLIGKSKGAPNNGLVFDYETLCKIVLQSEEYDYKGIVVNPGIHMLLISKDYITGKYLTITQPTMQRQGFDEGETVHIGTPYDYPKKFVEQVSKILKKYPNVRAAYLGLMEIKNEFSFLIAVDCNEDVSELFQKIGSVAMKIRLDKPLDLTIVGTELGVNLVSVCPPFYVG